METIVTRTATPVVTYRGADLTEHVVGFAYTDHAESALDELRIDLQDRDRIWQGSWYPGKAEKISAKIVCKDWFAQGDSLQLDCGTFEISNIKISGPPSLVTISAVSAKVSRSARTQKKTKGWEDVDLKTIAQHVAGEAGLTLGWDGQNINYQRVDQRNEGDLPFLKRLCDEAGNSVKVAGEKLLVYEGKKWDEREPSGTITEGAEWIENYDLDSDTHDRYQACEVSYWDSDLKEQISAKYSPPEAPATGEILKINSKVRDRGQAERIAKNTLRRKNRAEVKGTLTLTGDPRRMATQVLNVAGYGAYDGRYFVDQAEHVLDPNEGGFGYQTILTIRKVLGY